MYCIPFDLILTFSLLGFKKRFKKNLKLAFIQFVETLLMKMGDQQKKKRIINSIYNIVCLFLHFKVLSNNNMYLM